MSTYNSKINKLLHSFINNLKEPLFLLMLCLSLKPVSATQLYITDNGEVTVPIVKLMGLTGIRIENDPLPSEDNWPAARLTLSSRNLAEVVKAVQGKIDPSVTWLGDTKKERWEVDPLKLQLTPEIAERVKNICWKELNQGVAIYPQQQDYEGLLLPGTTLSGVRKRLQFLNGVYDKDKSLLDLPLDLLTGERTLDPAIGETKEQLYNPDNGIISFRKDWVMPQKDYRKNITDEGEMMLLVLDQSHHPCLDSKKVTYVYSPKGTGKRATTESTVIAWLNKRSVKSGHYLAISHQPYTFYQECTIKRTLLKNGRSDIIVDVAGPAPDLETGAEATFKSLDYSINLLNNLSRILWELSEIRKLEGKAGS